jgi:hypothetical protein
MIDGSSDSCGLDIPDCFARTSMMRQLAGLLCVCAFSSGVWGADLSVEALSSEPPKDALAPEIAETLQPSGFVVKEGDQVKMEVWLRKEWPTSGGDSFSFEILYPFEPGELMGAVRFPERGSDFRQQTIPAGVYTLRYALQPVDGNHVGTFPTRDFLLVIAAEKDRQPAPLDPKTMESESPDSIESSHPGILPLLGPATAGETVPSIRHDQDNDWWIVTFQGKTTGTPNGETLPVDVVVGGHAAE